ncbi:MAG: GNAT family N-acetyltransferase [Lachnospiraceae bacterium]|nr:GNAT family N-acetyltransferase [Lachnospiraceae bacterium]
MKQDIGIRKAVEADLDCIEKLYEDLCDHLETHTNYPGWKKNIYPVRSDAEKGFAENALYVARIGEKTVGTIILRHEPEEGYRNGKWLTADDYQYIYVVYTLAVHPDFLKCGIGTKLLMFAEQVARKEQCVSIRLDVVKDNIPAEKLYQKNGYQLIGTVSLGYEAYGLPWYNLYEKIL